MFELMDCENTMLTEIGMKEMKRKDIAQTYSLALRSSERDRIDWGKVNRAIIDRWSLAALKWIKEQAHSGKCFSDKTVDVSNPSA
jgi:hypothetical protein